MDQLRAHRQQQLTERMAAANRWDDGDLVFAQPNGRPIDSRRDWKSWKDLLAAAGVRDARLHDARHTAATLLLEQGVDVRIVMEVLGHANVQLTQNTYQHVMPRVIAAATQGVADHLFAPEATGVARVIKKRKSR
ncbi:MAG: Integrase [Frankiales bacterium]|nr:Integrase [Frankiales bacterium]